MKNLHYLIMKYIKDMYVIRKTSKKEGIFCMKIITPTTIILNSWTWKEY